MTIYEINKSRQHHYKVLSAMARTVGETAIAKHYADLAKAV